MKRVQVIPKEGINLYSKLIKKEVELSRKNRGTLYRSALKKKGREKWSHTDYKGWVNFQAAIGGVVVVEVHTKASRDEEWKLFHAFMGFLDRHFREEILAINIQYD